jgi:hypothetical protein
VSESTASGGTIYGATQGSTMASPRSEPSTTMAGSSATSIGGDDRLGTTSSENFDQRMSDYAAQHNAPARTGSEVQPGDMGPANSKGE